MAIDNKYDPKDMESLLFHKEFFELEEEEKDFAMQHVDSEQEYADMRSTLLNISVAMQEEEELVPAAGIREQLMGEFGNQGSGKVIGINSIGSALFPKDKKIYQMPAFKAGIAAMLVIAAVFFYWDNNPTTNTSGEQDFAEVRKENKDESLVKKPVAEGKRAEGQKTPPDEVSEPKTDMATVTTTPNSEIIDESGEIAVVSEKSEEKERNMAGPSGEVNSTNVVGDIASISKITEEEEITGSSWRDRDVTTIDDAEVEDADEVVVAPASPVIDEVTPSREVTSEALNFETSHIAVDTVGYNDNIAMDNRSQDTKPNDDAMDTFGKDLAQGVFAGATGGTATKGKLEDSKNRGSESDNKSGSTDYASGELAYTDTDKSKEKAEQQEDIADPGYLAKEEVGRSKTDVSRKAKKEASKKQFNIANAEPASTTTTREGRLDDSPGIFAELAEAARQSRPVSKDKQLIDILYTAF